MITVPVAVLLLALYMIIFGFSAQDGEASGSISRLISERCVEFINNISGRHWSAVFMEKAAEYFEHPIRKLAHLSEYACMGILVYVIWSQWLRKGRKIFLLTVLWVFVSAAADEFHQLFVPGRYCSLMDVFLDTIGGIFGMLVCMAFRKIYLKHKGKKKK